MESNWEEAAARIRARFDAGRRVDAWHELQQYYEWGFARGDATFLKLAHDLSWWLGFETRRQWLGRRIRIAHPNRLWATTRTLFDALRKGRILECYERLLAHDLPKAESELDARWLELARARVLSYAREFERAHATLDEAEQRGGSADPDLQRERAWTQWQQDETEAALATCLQARQQAPDNAFLREQECWFLLQNDRSGDALATLAETCRAIQCPSLELLHADARIEAGELEEGREHLERIISAMPLDRHQQISANMQLARVHRRLGNGQAALSWLRQAGPRMHKWHDRLQSFLAQQPDNDDGGGRHTLPVPFVRQDHVTCSPATMASLLRHAGVDVEQREIASQITYDGTPSHAEMEWARTRGLHIWFFQFDLEVAHQLLDLGLPFALSTRGEQMGHRQAVCGYDRGLGTLIVRDPNYPSLQEIDAQWLQEHMRTRGGDCALLLPESLADKVPTELLPEHQPMMLLQELRQAYDQRDLGRAERIGAELLAGEPSTARWEAATRIAYEREDRRERLRLYRERYEQHTKDSYWQYHYAVELRSQDRWQPFVELLERHSSGKSPHQTLMLADHLRHAAPTQARAELLARRAARQLPTQALPVKIIADICWADRNRREHSLALYRMCAALEPHDESLAASYASACTLLGKSEQGLSFLQRRVDSIGSKRWEARATLARALEGAHRRSEAVQALREALTHVDEPGLREQLFDLLLADSQREAAAALLDDAQRWRPLPLQDARRRLAAATGDHAAASAALHATLALDPSNGAAWGAVLHDLLATDGREAALARAHECVEQHGENPRVLVHVQEFYEEIEERALSEQLMRRLHREHPEEWWLLGRLTRHLIRTGRAAEAAPHVATMLEQMPDSAAVWLDAIDASEETGDLDRCRQLLEQAPEHWNQEPAFLSRRRQLAENREQSAAAVRSAMAAALLNHTPPEQQDLDFVVNAIAQDLDNDHVETFLKELQERFPDAPSLAAARCQWLSERDAEAAVVIAKQLQADFPWLLPHWILLGRCLRSAGQRDEERALLEKLLEREPTYGQAWVELGESFEQEGRTQEAMQTYQRGIEQSPNNSTLHGMRASLSWSFGDRDGALQSADRAALLSPDYGWVRRAQVIWRAQVGQHAEALAHAESCARDNPSWRLSYELLATAHGALGNQEERLEALRQAVRIDPRVGSARTQLLEGLLELRKFDEAEQVIAAGLQLLGDEPELLVMRLRILRMQGDLPGARSKLVELLEQHEDYVGGWFTLLGWLDDEQRDQDILQLCRKLPKAIADNPTPHCYSADVRIRKRDFAGAEDDLRTALRIAPDHDWARDRLAEVLLKRDKPKQILELFPGATDPDQQPFERAAMLCQCHARAKQRDLAETFFLRLLREPEASFATLHNTDEVLRDVDEGAQLALLQRVLRESAQDRDALRHENAFSILITDCPKDIWDRMDALAEWLPPGDRVEVLSRLLYASNGYYPPKVINDWIARNLQPPIDDTDSWARILYALNDVAGAATAVRLTDGNYRRPGVRGWMLANLASAHADLEQWQEVEAISNYAMSSDVPADHSVWWHRRYLAECAYQRGEYERCLELCDMATESFPSEKVRVVQLAALARIQLAGSWLSRRRAFLDALPEIKRQAVRADAENSGPHDKTELDWWRLFRAAPTMSGLLLALRTRKT